MPMDFLLSHLTLLGADLQWWMPILGGVTAVYAFWLVRRRPEISESAGRIFSEAGFPQDSQHDIRFG
jgi:hypothetical protein